jgi:hypothetical protein
MSNSLVKLIPFLLLAIFMTVAIILALKSKNRLKTVATQYASQHGWEFNTKPPDVPIFMQLNNYRAADKTLIEGDLAGYHFWLYDFWWGAGGYPGRMYASYHLVIKVPFELPTAEIIPRNTSMMSNAVLNLSNNIAKFNFKLAALALDPETDKRFSVLVDKGQESLCKKYLTPDFLKVVEQKIKSSVTFSGQYICIYALKSVAPKNQQALDQLFANAETLLKVVSRDIRT